MLKSVHWYFIVALSMRVFADISEEALPKRRIWVNIESLVFVKELSVSFINCAQEGASLISKVSPSKLHEQNGFRVSWKLCLNLCSRKCLRLRRSLVRYLVILQLWQLNTLFGDDLTGSVLKVTIVALRKMRGATIVAWRVLLIQTRLSC